MPRLQRLHSRSRPPPSLLHFCGRVLDIMCFPKAWANSRPLLGTATLPHNHLELFMRWLVVSPIGSCGLKFSVEIIPKWFGVIGEDDGTRTHFRSLGIDGYAFGLPWVQAPQREGRNSPRSLIRRVYSCARLS